MITKNVNNNKRDRVAALYGDRTTSGKVQKCTNEARKRLTHASLVNTEPLVVKAAEQPSSSEDGGGWTEVYSKRKLRLQRLRRNVQKMKCPFIRIGKGLYPRDECDRRSLIIYHNFQSAKQLYILLSKTLADKVGELVSKVRIVRRYSRTKGLVYAQIICEPGKRERVLTCLEASKTFNKYTIKRGKTYSERARLIKEESGKSMVKVVVRKEREPSTEVSVTNRFSTLESSVDLLDGGRKTSVLDQSLRVITLNCNGIDTTMPRLWEFCSESKPHIVALQESYIHEDYIPHLIGYQFFGNRLSGSER